MVKLLAHLSPKENSIEKYFLLLFWGLETIQVSRHSQAILTWSSLFPCWQNISQCILTPFVKKIYLPERQSDLGVGERSIKRNLSFAVSLSKLQQPGLDQEKAKCLELNLGNSILGPCKLVSTSRYMNCGFILALWFS